MNQSLYEGASNWISFLRGYAPVSRNENLFDESIRRSAKRLGVLPLDFSHPAREEVIACLTAEYPVSVVLTGTAGDGKTYLCRQVWEALNGNAEAWQSNESHVVTTLPLRGGRTRALHVIRDLSDWTPQRGTDWRPERRALLEQFSLSLVDGTANDLYLVAGNDGQLVELWRRLAQSEAVARAQQIIEQMLVENRRDLPGVSLKFFNLSRYSSAELLDNALEAILNHSGWDKCRALDSNAAEFFGPTCPIRHNLSLLGTELVRDRLRSVFSLCDHNQAHIPIRQVLLLLSNGILGHPDVRHGLMKAADVPGILRAGTGARSNLFNNLFGSNLAPVNRDSRLVFEALDRFGIGYETSNRVDNILVFGDADEELKPDFDRLVSSDPLYRIDNEFKAAQMAYVEGSAEDQDKNADFLALLVGQRRSLFFRIPAPEASELRLWELTVFKFAGEYLDRVVSGLKAGKKMEKHLLSRLVRGLNRVFTGMLFSSDRELLLASSLTVSGGRVSRLLEDQISVDPRLGESVDVVMRDSIPTLEVALGTGLTCSLPLYLTRYEFLSRVAEGALPNSFSRECYEDLLAFRSRLLTVLNLRRAQGGENQNAMSFRILGVDDGGRQTIQDLEARDV